MTEPANLSGTLPNSPAPARRRAVVMHELRQLLSATEGSRQEGLPKILPFGLAALDSHLAEGGLACGGLHEVVPEMQAAFPAAFGFIVALLARISCPSPLVFVLPAYARRQYGRLCGHGLNALGLDPARLIFVETAHRKDTLWAMAEALRSAAPAAVAGMIDKLDLKTSQKLHLAASDAGPAAVAVAAGADAGSKRCGNALARRHGGSRARPLRPLRASPMASAA